MARRVTTVLASAQRQGSVTSAPLVPNTASRDFVVGVSLDALNVVDGANTMDVVLEGSFDAGISWRLLAATTWQGGFIGRDGLPVAPRIGTRSDVNPDQIRIRLDGVRRQRIAALVDEDQGG